MYVEQLVDVNTAVFVLTRYVGMMEQDFYNKFMEESDAARRPPYSPPPPPPHGSLTTKTQKQLIFSDGYFSTFLSVVKNKELN